MSGSGHNNAEQLAFARQLAASFKAGDPSSQKFRGKKKPNHALPAPVQFEDPRPQRPFVPHRLIANLTSSSNDVPPPSQRRYEHSLSENPFQNGPGRIMGTRAMDFLARVDVIKPAVGNTANRENLAVGTTSTITSTTTGPGNTQEKQNSDTVVSHTVKVAEITNVLKKQDISSGKPVLSQPGMSTADPTTNKASRNKLATAPPSNGEKTVSKNIMDTFFFMLQETPMPTIPEQKSMPVKQESVAAVESPDSQSVRNRKPSSAFDRLLNRHASETKPEESTGVFASTHENAGFSNVNPITKQNTKVISMDRQNLRQNGIQSLPEAKRSDPAPSSKSVGGKTDDSKSSDSPKLRPHAPGFVPKTAEKEKTVPNLGSSYGIVPQPPCIEQAQQAKIPVLQDQAPLPTSPYSFVVPSGPSVGNLITVTQVHFANGVLVPGHTNGQLWLQTPVNTVDHPATHKAAVTTETSKSRLDPKIPVQGLSGSMWSK